MPSQPLGAKVHNKRSSPDEGSEKDNNKLAHNGAARVQHPPSLSKPATESVESDFHLPSWGESSSERCPVEVQTQTSHGKSDHGILMKWCHSFLVATT